MRTQAIEGGAALHTLVIIVSSMAGSDASLVTTPVMGRPLLLLDASTTAAADFDAAAGAGGWLPGPAVLRYVNASPPSIPACPTSWAERDPGSAGRLQQLHVMNALCAPRKEV